MDAIAGAGRAASSPPAPDHGTERMRKAAREFEAMMLGQMFEMMFAGMKADGMFGGGQAEQTFRSLLLQEYATAVTAAGGIGIADQVYREIKSIHAGEAEERDGIGKTL